MKYDFSAIEKKWQEKWQKEKTYQTKNFVKGETTKVGADGSLLMQKKNRPPPRISRP